MNEIEKMYENAGIEKQEPLFCEYFNYSSRDLYERCTRFHKYCADGHFGMKEMCPCGLSKSEHENMFKYPPFTAEKQIELIKWLVVNKEIFTIHYKRRFLYCCEEDRHSSACQENFEESLAALVNVIWQDLTAEEKQQVKEILE